MLNQNEKLNDTYTLLEELGHGGGGIVYKAYHERLNTYVVVKKIKDQVKGKLDGRAEADILKRMKHTYLPQVYDFLEIDGEIYTVIDYIPGKSLDKALEEEGRFEQKRVLKWARQLAEALDYLHRQTPPIIHSDIKPANIMLTPDDNICLIDFNISLALDSSMKNSTGISEGYSPPEQYRSMTVYRSFTRTKMPEKGMVTIPAVKLGAAGETVVGQKAETKIDTKGMWTVKGTKADISETSVSDKEKVQHNISEVESFLESTVGHGVDARSDIYSLGATLYHLLTGIRPSNNFEQIIPLEQCGIQLSEGLLYIVKKMMELSPEKRYQDGTQLLYALQNIRELDSIYRIFKRKNRNKKLVIAALYLTGGILAGGGWKIRQNEIDTVYNRSIVLAEEYIEAGKCDDSAEILAEAIEMRPKRIEAYEKELFRLYQFGDYESCIRYGADIKKKPVYEIKSENDEVLLANVYYVLGNAYIEMEDYANASLNLEEAIARYAGNSLYYRDYAISLVKTGNIEAAEDVLELAISLQLGEDSIYMVRGEITYAKNEYLQAEEYLLKAIAFTEDENLRKRAVLLCDKVYRTQGTDYINREIALLEQEENRAGGAFSAMNLTECLADVYARKAEQDEVHRQEYYEKALEKFTFLYNNGYSTRQMLENIAILLEQMNEYEKAEDALMQMLEKYPDSYEGYKRLAYLEADIQQTKENSDRDYSQMKVYYEKAKELYKDQKGDQEMQMLDALLEELKAGNWF